MMKKTKGWNLAEYFVITMGHPHWLNDSPTLMEGNEKHYLETIMKILDTISDKEFDKIVSGVWLKK